MGEDGAALSLASRAIPAAAARTTGYLSRPCCARTGRSLRDLPPLFGHWNSVFTRFRDKAAWASLQIGLSSAKALPFTTQGD